MSQSKTAYIYLILTMLLWSATPAVAKLALGELDNYQLLFYTNIVWVISLFLINIFQGKLKILGSYTTKEYMIMFGMGGIGIFLYYVLLYGSFSLAPAGQVNVMNYLWPVFIILFSILLLKEKFNYKTIIAVILGFAGALIAFTQWNILAFSNQYSLGYILAWLAAICYGLFSVLGKKFKYDEFSSMLIYYISATILTIPMFLFVSNFVIPKSLTTIIAIIALGGIMNSIAFVFWFKALKLWHTHKIANLIYLVPFLAMIRTYFLNSEPLAISSVVWLLLIMVWVFVQLKNKI